jgi:hypothetical protein
MQLKRLRRRFFLGFISCLFLLGTSLPALSQGFFNSVRSSNIVEQRIATHLLEAEIALMAESAAMTKAPAMKYSIMLSGMKVAPKMVVTGASGTVGAMLMGDRLVVRGDFQRLTSPLRDYATDPLNPPNPKITSGIHIHQGDSAKNGLFQYALMVEPMTDGLSGKFSGDYTLTPEQLKALSSGMLYVDLHTQKNRAGELRGVFKSA